MAIDFKEYVQVIHKGSEIPSLKIHNSDISKFMFDLRINGKRYRKTISVQGTTKGRNIELAKFQLDQFIAQESKKTKQALTPSASPDLSVSDYFNRLLEIKRNSWSEAHTYQNKNFFNKNIHPIIGDKKISDIKPADITTIASNLSHLSKRMQKRLLEVLHPLFELAIEDESIQISPIKKSHRVTRKLTEEKKVILNAVEKYKTVYKSIMSIYQDHPTMRAILLFGFYGRRKNEVLSLKWENIDLKHNTFIIPKEESKVGVDLEFSLPQEIKTALEEIAVFTGKEGLVFKSPRGGQYTEIRDHIYAIRNDTKIDEFGFHWMRNLAVSALSSQGVDAIHLSALLGHTDTHTVKQYLSLQRREASEMIQDISKELLK